MCHSRRYWGLWRNFTQVTSPRCPPPPFANSFLNVRAQFLPHVGGLRGFGSTLPFLVAVSAVSAVHVRRARVVAVGLVIDCVAACDGAAVFCGFVAV